MKNRKLGSGASSDALLLMFIKLVTILLGFVVTRLLSEHLSVYDYGTYSQILLVVSTVATLTILGMMDGVNYYWCSGKDLREREQYVATIFALQCVVSTVAGTAVLCLSGPLCRYFDNPDVSGLLIFAAALPLLQNLLGMLQVLLVSVGKARILALRNLIVSLVRLGAVLLVVTTIHNVAVVLAATVIMDLVQILLFTGLLRKNQCALRLSNVDPKLLGRILSYCAPMAVFTMVSGLNRDLDKYLIAWMTDTQTLAIYTNASKVLPFDIVMTSFCTVLLPRITRLIAQKEHHRAAELYREFLEISYICTGILCCAALAAAPQLMQLLYSSKYLDGLPVFCIYILVDLLRLTNITLILSAAGKTRTLMFLGVGTLALNAVLNLALYHLFGVTGPALATLAATALMGIVLLKLGAKELRSKLSSLFDGWYLLAFCLEAILAVAVFSLGRNWLQQHIQSFFVLVLVAGGFGICMLLLNGKRLLKALKKVNIIGKSVNNREGQ